MSLLVIQIPARPRLGVRVAAEAMPAARAAAQFDYLLSPDGRTVASSARAAPAALPKAASVVAVLADADVAWHRVTPPKAPPARLRAALAGVMEEALLDDDEASHFALEPQARAGVPGWVAVVNRPWLAATLAALESSGLLVERVVPSSVPPGPGEPASGHFFTDETDARAAPRLALAQADGVSCLRIDGSLARALAPADAARVRWSATPSATAAAERWLGAAVPVLTEAERALQASRSAWNLRQFDLAPRRRGTRALREAARRLLSPAWRPVRVGLFALAAVQLIGLNIEAWRQKHDIAARRAEMVALLEASQPGLRAIVDPPLQMQRETERLRAAAGRPGAGDLEVLLAAAAAAWPDGQGPVQTLEFDPGHLTLAARGWGETQLAQFRARLKPAGYAAELSDGRVVVSARPRGLG
jgi:general secretion pathway protein L